MCFFLLSVYTCCCQTIIAFTTCDMAIAISRVNKILIFRDFIYQIFASSLLFLSSIGVSVSLLFVGYHSMTESANKVQKKFLSVQSPPNRLHTHIQRHIQRNYQRKTDMCLFCVCFHLFSSSFEYSKSIFYVRVSLKVFVSFSVLHQDYKNKLNRSLRTFFSIFVSFQKQMINRH